MLAYRLEVRLVRSTRAHQLRCVCIRHSSLFAALQHVPGLRMGQRSAECCKHWHDNWTLERSWPYYYIFPTFGPNGSASQTSRATPSTLSLFSATSWRLL